MGMTLEWVPAPSGKPWGHRSGNYWSRKKSGLFAQATIGHNEHSRIRALA